MKFFIDSCDVTEIREAQQMGLLDGVALNRATIEKSGKLVGQLILEIRETAAGPIFVEALGLTMEDLIEAGENLAGSHKDVVLQMPVSLVGIKAMKHFTGKGIKTHLTNCFSIAQALVAAKAGASYVSPLPSPLDDVTSHEMPLLNDIRLMYERYRFDTQIIVNETPTVVHLIAAAKAGSDGVTASFSVIRRLLTHPLTESGLGAFFTDLKKAKT